MSYYEKRIAELEARVARLAREQRMKAIPVEAKLLERYAVMQADNTRLKAEVERLTFDPLTYLDDQGEWMPRHIHLAAVERLKAEVERLRTAGDAMYEWICLQSADVGNELEDWADAKEGKPSA